MLTRYQRVMVGFCEIADGLLAVLTLGSKRRNYAFHMTAKYELRNLKRCAKERNARAT